MKTVNKQIIFFIWFLLLLSSFIPFLSKINAWDQYLIQAQKLADFKIINDNKTNPTNYNIENNISRWEMAKIMLNLAWVWPNLDCKWLFKDVSSTTPNNWICWYVEKWIELWLLAKNPNFRPNDRISKSESLKMIMWWLWINVENKSNNWQKDYITFANSIWLIDDLFSDYNSSAIRWFIFDIWARWLEKNNNTSILDLSKENNMMCTQVITYGINPKTNECVQFPNSCMPKDFKKVDRCNNLETSYKQHIFDIEFQNRYLNVRESTLHYRHK